MARQRLETTWAESELRRWSHLAPVLSSLLVLSYVLMTLAVYARQIGCFTASCLDFELSLSPTLIHNSYYNYYYNYY